MTTKHTPGPWIPRMLDGDEYEWHIDMRELRFDCAWEAAIVCYGVYDCDDGPAIAKANAHLVAAAPDMLEALRAVLAERSPAAQLSDACFRAAAAIAKAEGRKP